MKKILWIAGLTALPFMAGAALVGFNAENGSSDSTTVSATLGADFAPQGDVNALGGVYLAAGSNGTGGSPGTVARVASYEVDFPEAGTYDLYVRAYCGPNVGGDDSMFYGNGFGAKNETVDGDWITCNGAWGLSLEEYHWINVSADTGGSGEAPVTFTVPSAGTYTFEVGAREDGFRFDAFAFGSTNTYFSDEELSVAAGDPVVELSYSTVPFHGALIPADLDIVVTATNGSVSLSSVLDDVEMLLIQNGVTNDVSSGVVSAINSWGMTFSYAEDLAYMTDYSVVFNIYRSDAATDSIEFSFTTAPESYVLMSGTSQAGDQSLIDFLKNNFRDVDVVYGDFSDYFVNSALIMNSDVFMVGRSLSSGAFADYDKSTAFNALTNPVVAFSSYLTRATDNRWGWHSGDLGTTVIDGNETTVTNAGVSVFGLSSGSYDWFPGTGSFSRSGLGDIGDGELLATIGVDNAILSAHWSAGDYVAGGQLGGERLLFNLNQVDGATILPTGQGEVALIKALASYTPLVPQAEYIATTYPVDGSNGVALNEDIMVTVSDIGINWSSQIVSYEMRVNSSVVQASRSSVNGVTTFTYSPSSDLEYDTVYNIELEVVRSGGVTDNVNFSFTTVPNYILDVLISGTSQSGDQPLIDFLHNNFQGPIKITYGDYSDFVAHSNEIVNADLFMVGRSFTSSAYDNSENSASFNSLPNPVVVFSSYIVRNAGSRWGWHSGDAVITNMVTGAESVVTADGYGVFGVAPGAYDWFEGTNVLNAAGSGTVGTGEILTTIGTDIIAAHWGAGDTTALGAALGGERLLFNLAQDGSTTVLPSGDGERALIKALSAYTPLQAHPSSAPDIMIVTAGSGSVSLSWLTEVGTGYNLQMKSTLSGGTWQTVGNVVGDGSTYSTNVQTDADMEFFRIEIQ